METINIMPQKGTLKKLSSCKLHIPLHVENKITKACQKIWDVEWSGILFFTYTGTFDTNLTIKCEDILLMDIGSTTYTEYDMSPEVVSYMVENNLLDCKIGHIHSHNHMDSFFSGTDINTLIEEGKNVNNFVSLVVNNKGKYVAAITQKVTKSRKVDEKATYRLFDSEPNIKNNEFTEEYDNVEAYSIEVTTDNNDSSIDSKIEELKSKKVTGFSIFNNPLQHMEDIKIQQNLPQEECKKTDINHIIAQIVTGSITIPYNEKSNLTKMVASMNTLYKKRFGDSKEGLEKCEEWATLYIDFLLPTNCKSDELDLIVSNLSNALLHYKESYDNPYLDIFINELNNYIDYDYNF